MTTAGTDHSGNSNLVVNSIARNKINKISIIESMKRAGMGSATNGTGFLFSLKIFHELIKKHF